MVETTILAGMPSLWTFIKPYAREIFILESILY